jgi:hypothetical protein
MHWAVTTEAPAIAARSALQENFAIVEERIKGVI